MSIGRESRSAAAVVAGAVARPLALVLALVSTLPGGALSKGLPLPRPTPHLNVTCHGVPYPFGVRSESLPGFEVICGPNNEAMLPIGEHRYKISVVSVLESFVIIFAGPITQVCYDHDGKPTPATGTGPMNLEGTPFTFSKSNMLVNVGCNYTFIANFTNPPGDPNPWPLLTSCSTLCSGSSDAIIRGSCNGEACCKIDTSVPVNGVKAFTPSFNRTTANITGEEYGTCSAAFFLDKYDQIFTSNGGDEGGMPLKEALLPPGERRMYLDWAIGSDTCDQAQSYTFDPLCNDMSDCVDAPSGAGYRCKCHEGYEGNPYVKDGCKGNKASSSATDLSKVTQIVE